MTDRSNCYALEDMLFPRPVRTEFGLGPMRTWLSDFRLSTLQSAVPQLIVKLDRMSRCAMSASMRRNLLRELQRPLLKAVSALPKGTGEQGARDRGHGGTLLLEQRLYCLMVKNLKQVLQDLDASMDAFGTEVSKRRRWTVRTLFRYLRRQIELGLFGGLPLPRHTWQELHDLHAYAIARHMTPRNGKGGREERNYNFDPDREYKRLLLLGLAGRLVQHRPWSEFVKEKIDLWVADTRLESPDAFVGKADLYVVETSKDTPPRQLQGELAEPFRGWILRRPSGFLSDVAAIRRVGSAAESTVPPGSSRVDSNRK